MFTRKLIAGIVVAIGVAGAGVAAAAVGGGTGSVATAEDTTTTTSTTVVLEPSTTTVAPTTTSPRVADIPESAGADGARSTEGCGGETYKNHGAFVSSVARDPDRQPGDVAAAAQSMCGKPVTSVDDAEHDEDTTDATDSQSSQGPSSAAHGNGKANPHR